MRWYIVDYRRFPHLSGNELTVITLIHGECQGFFVCQKHEPLYCYKMKMPVANLVNLTMFRDFFSLFFPFFLYFSLLLFFLSLSRWLIVHSDQPQSLDRWHEVDSNMTISITLIFIFNVWVSWIARKLRVLNKMTLHQISYLWCTIHEIIASDILVCSLLCNVNVLCCKIGSRGYSVNTF